MSRSLLIPLAVIIGIAIIGFIVQKISKDVTHDEHYYNGGGGGGSSEDTHDHDDQAMQ